MASDAITPFRIEIPDGELDDLRRRLRGTRWPDAETVEDWSQGIPLAYVQEVCSYWAEKYDWRATEARLNEFPQFKTEIDGLDIHFIHQRSKHEDAFPLLITHGWPGSVYEFHKIIDPLTNPTDHGGKAEDAFHVVCPSIPGYAFSDKPSTHGTGVEKIATMWDELMVRLGYDRYGAQGGDWGSAITTQIGRENRGQCAGIHINMPLGAPTEEAMANPTAADQDAIAAQQEYQQWDSGYSTQQRTRPQTLGYGLVDSPVGQMAWIVEKFWKWTDNDGSPEDALTRDEMLTNVMLYWLPGCGASSARLYWESFGAFRDRKPVEVPTGAASFPREIIKAPRSWCEASYNLTHWTDMPRGGHFAAFEQPELFVDDLRTFFGTIR